MSTLADWCCHKSTPHYDSKINLHFVVLIWLETETLSPTVLVKKWIIWSFSGRKMVRSIPDKYWAGKQTFDKTKSKKESTEIVTAMGLSATATSSTPALPATGRAPEGGLIPSAVLQEPVPLDSTSTQLGLPPGPMAFLQAISGGATMPPQALPLPSMVSAPGLPPGSVVQGFPPVSMPPPLGLPPGALVSSGLPPTSIPPPGLPPGSLISPNFPPSSMAPPGLPPGTLVLQGLPPSLAPPQGFPPSTLAQPGLPPMALSMPPGFVTSTSTTQPLVASSILTPQPSGPQLGNTKGVQLAQLLCKVFGGGTAKKTAPGKYCELLTYRCDMLARTVTL